jgi:hypothetical protein
MATRAIPIITNGFSFKRSTLEGDSSTHSVVLVIKTLEFLQLHFAKSGHGDLLMTRQLISAASEPLFHPPHAKRPPPGGFVLTTFSDKLRRDMSGQELAIQTTGASDGFSETRLRARTDRHTHLPGRRNRTGALMGQDHPCPHLVSFIPKALILLTGDLHEFSK